MSHFAKIENGIVKEIVVAEQDFIDTGALGDPSLWIQTSYNTYGNKHPENRPLRGNYAVVGGHYDAENDVFYTQKPYESWTLNQDTWLWEAPVTLPTDREGYTWDESRLTWIWVEDDGTISQVVTNE
jgi:hypothetical protein